MYHENKISRKRERDLYNTIGLVIKPQQSICCIKIEDKLSSHKA